MSIVLRLGKRDTAVLKYIIRTFQQMTVDSDYYNKVSVKETNKLLFKILDLEEKK